MFCISTPAILKALGFVFELNTTGVQSLHGWISTQGLNIIEENVHQ